MPPAGPKVRLLPLRPVPPLSFSCWPLALSTASCPTPPLCSGCALRSLPLCLMVQASAEGANAEA
eukprot:2452807-Alexandrium_andersonii.AAC.1